MAVAKDDKFHELETKNTRMPGKKKGSESGPRSVRKLTTSWTDRRVRIPL